MFIDSEGKLFGKISIVDIIIVLVIIGVVGGVGYKFTRSKTTNMVQQQNLEIQFYFEEVPEFSTKLIKKGDAVKDPTRNSEFGVVKDVEIKEAICWAPDNNGIQVSSPKQGYKSILLTVEGKGIYGDRGITIDNSDYFVGKTLEIRAGNSALWVRIKSIEKKE